MSINTIKLKIHEESDLYSPFDPDQELLSDDVVDYFMHCFQNKHKSGLDQYVIRIISDTPVDAESAKQKIRAHISRERENIKRMRRKRMIDALCLAIFGVIVLSIWFFLSADSESVNLEVLSIIGWVAIWEATSILLMGRHEINRLKRNLDTILKAQIEIEVAPE